jgi:hypothetical protein
MRPTTEPSVGAEVLEQTEDYRRDVRALLTRLAVEAGAPDPIQLATQLFLLYHGGSVVVTHRQQAEMLPALRNAAEALIDAALAA